MLTDREWLRREYVERGRSVKEIAEALGLTQSAISMRLSRAAIPRRPRPGRPQTVFPGQRYGRLVVVREAGRADGAKGERLFACDCDCGSGATVLAYSLRSGNTRSCGCLGRERAIEAATRHGKCGSPAYLSWKGMKQRCLDPNADNYERYGAKGTAPCGRMRTFEGFYATLGDRPAGKSIDRIDGRGGYWCGACDDCRANGWPLNVRWATAVEQRSNRVLDREGGGSR